MIVAVVHTFPAIAGPAIDGHPHGTTARYESGCKCLPCRAAIARYAGERRMAIRNGDWKGLVPAAAAQRHLRALSRAGVGYRSVEAACDVSESGLRKIKNGRTRKILPRTESKILSVTREAFAGGAIVKPGRTWQRIKHLLDEGFSKAELARRLGSKAKYPHLQLNRKSLRGRNVCKVERLYRLIEMGASPGQDSP